MADPRDKKPPPIPKLAEKAGTKPAVTPMAKPPGAKTQLPSLAEMSTEGLPSVMVDLGDPSQPKLSDDATMILPARQMPQPQAAKAPTRSGTAPSLATPAKPPIVTAPAKQPSVDVGEATLILTREPAKKEPPKQQFKEPAKESAKEPPRRLASPASEGASTVVAKAAPVIAASSAKTVVGEIKTTAAVPSSPPALGLPPPPAAPLQNVSAAPSQPVPPPSLPVAKAAPLSLQGKPLPAPRTPNPPATVPSVPALLKPATSIAPPGPPKDPPRRDQPPQPPSQMQMERRIRELIHKFDVPALMDALLSIGYREDQIDFVSNPVLTHRASLLEDIEFFRDPPRVLVLTNYGLLGGQGPIPSYFFELLSEQRDSSMTEFLWFFDSALQRQRFAGLYPERDRSIIPDFLEVKHLQLALLQLGAPIGMHWLFRLVYPELPVSVRRSIQKRRVRTDGVRMGDAELGSGCAFGGFTQVPVGGIDVRLLCEEWNTPTGQPWAHVAEKRLSRLIIPSLESSDVYLTVTLVFLDRQSFARLAPQNFLGYEPISAPLSDEGPPPVQQVVVFQGETGRSPH